ncbi:MAG TPA: hypothetical protein VHW09_28930 [Bryobacteraceae bacterium]|jgi:hypothetical protein|nr:hypothetical protein [Bryobacteraceae bacterium]
MMLRARRIAWLGLALCFATNLPAQPNTVRSLILKAESRYDDARRAEQSAAVRRNDPADMNRALTGYRQAEGVLETPIQEGLLAGANVPLGEEDEVRNRYASAAVLSSSISLDAVRMLLFLGRTATPDFGYFKITARESAVAVLDVDQRKGCVKESGAGPSFPGVWSEPPVPGEQAIALMVLGRLQLLDDDRRSARGCFQQVLKIDRENHDAAQFVHDLADDCSFCLSARAKAAVGASLSIGALLLEEKYPLGAPLTGIILNALNTLIPTMPSH